MKTVFLCALLFSPALAHADTKADLAKIETSFRACLDSADGQSNVGMKECTGQADAAADQVLNQVYDAIVASLSKKTGDSDADQRNAETLRRLKKSEQAWVAYRDADADLQGAIMLGGTGEPLMYLESLYNSTKARAQEIADLQF